LFANAWAIHNDENEYYSPEKFIPERFVDNKFGCRPEVVDTLEHHRRVTYGFGAGRRVCPGQRLAENSLVSSVLSSALSQWSSVGLLNTLLDAQYGEVGVAF
jgi:cytochrome P450